MRMSKVFVVVVLWLCGSVVMMVIFERRAVD